LQDGRPTRPGGVLNQGRGGSYEPPLLLWLG